MTSEDASTTDSAESLVDEAGARREVEALRDGFDGRCGNAEVGVDVSEEAEDCILVRFW